MTEREQDLHEGYAVAGRRLLWLALGLGLVIAAVLVLMYMVSRSLSAGKPPEAVRLPSALPLQQHPRADLEAHLRRDAQLRDGYAWLDRDADVARIPVRRAMEIMATRHQAAANMLGKSSNRNHPVDAEARTEAGP